MLARKKDEAEWGIIRCVSDTMGNSITHDTCEAHHAPVRQSVSFNSFAFDARRVRATTDYRSSLGFTFGEEATELKRLLSPVASKQENLTKY